MARVKKQKIRVIPEKLVCNVGVGVSVEKVVPTTPPAVLGAASTSLASSSKDTSVEITPPTTLSLNTEVSDLSSEKGVLASGISSQVSAHLGGTTLSETNVFEKGFKYVCDIASQTKRYVYSCNDHIMYRKFELPKPTSL